jgi:hypothetical protein
MTGFSASDAAIDGFRVIRQHWRLVVGWAVFNLLALLILVVVATIAIFIAAALAGSPQTAALVGGIIGTLLGGLGTFTVEAMMVAGLYRLLMRTEEPGFLKLRLGADEVRLVVVWLALAAMIAGLVAAMALAAGAAGKAGGMAFGLLAVLAVVCAAIYLLVRLSLTGPMTFERRRLSFIPAWRMTRGRFWPLAGMIVINLCLVAFMAVLGWLLMLGVTGLIFGFDGVALFPGEDAEAVGARPGPYLFQLAAQLVFAPVLWVISQAPSVFAYKALKALDA